MINTGWLDYGLSCLLALFSALAAKVHCAIVVKKRVGLGIGMLVVNYGIMHNEDLRFG